MTAVDLELTLRPAGHGYHAEARCLAPGSEASIDAAATVLIEPARLRELAPDPAAYGLALGQMVLVEAISRALDQAHVAAQRANVPLRLRLVVPADLQVLRWETLRDPAHPDAPLLTMGGQILFSRYLSSADWTPVQPRPLGGRRALVLLASPSDLADYGLAPFDVDAERAIIEQSLAPIPTTVLSAEQATLGALTEALRSGPDILYLMAHGRVDADGETWLYLEGADGKTTPVRGSEVATRIAEQAVRPQLIVLGSCETAGDGHGEALLTLGPLLARAGVPAVLAMQGRVTLETLRTFLPACLRVLIEDGRVDAAVSHARGLVRERPDFWAPVLFLQLLSGRLWVAPGAGPETPEELLERMPTGEVPQGGPALAPISRLRLHANRQFVGRTEEQARLAAQLKAGKTVVITTGIGGVGKTQLARMFAEHYGGFFAGGVFWLSFAEPRDIPAEVAACGANGLIERADFAELKQDAQVVLVRAAWQQPIPRLLIFDNCEEEALLREWLPKLGGCRVLVTSRRATWSPVLTVQTLRLDVLPREDSVRLLTQLAPQLTPQEADALAAELGDLPLALYLAGCYLAFYDDIAPETYLAKLRAINPLTHWSMQGDGVEVMPTDREPHVARAFALSFERLDPAQPIDALAQALLARAACFAPGEPFAREWLAATVEVPGDKEQQSRAYIKAIKRLLGLGLLERVGEGGVRLHRLLAAYAALALGDAEALPVVEQVVNGVASLANETNAPEAMQLVLPHLRYLVQRSDGRKDETMAMLCTNLGYYLFLRGNHREAQPLLELVVDIREQLLGSSHFDTALSLHNLGILYEAQGVYDQAQSLLERALAIYEQLLRSKHPAAIRTLNSLASVCWARGAYNRVQPLVERALGLCEQVLGPEHPDTALSLNNLARVFQAQGDYERALPLVERALGIYKQVFGSDHPAVGLSLNNLSALYSAQGAYDQAQSLLEQALAIYEQALGSNHPTTILSLNNLAKLYQTRGVYDQAQLLFERALVLCEHVLGGDHPDTGGNLEGLAIFYAEQGQFTKALPLLERVLAIRQIRLGPQHPATVQTQHNLGITRREAVLAALPEAMRAAMRARDTEAFQQTLQALPLEERQALVVRLVAVGIRPTLDDPYGLLLQAIAAIAQGNDAPRPQVEAAIAQLEQGGFHLTAAAQAIWAGQRDPTVLTEGLDATDTALVQRVLALLSVQR